MIYENRLNVTAERCQVKWQWPTKSKRFSTKTTSFSQKAGEKQRGKAVCVYVCVCTRLALWQAKEVLCGPMSFSSVGLRLVRKVCVAVLFWWKALSSHRASRCSALIQSPAWLLDWNHWLEGNFNDLLSQVLISCWQTVCPGTKRVGGIETAIKWPLTYTHVRWVEG